MTVDPVLYRGDIEYDLARILWSRLDEMDDNAVHVHFDTVVSVAGLDGTRAATWVIFRSVDYWLWGLEHGLTEDPVRCDRLVRLFLPRWRNTAWDTSARWRPHAAVAGPGVEVKRTPGGPDCSAPEAEAQ